MNRSGDNKPGRFLELEGLRGLAAIVVFIFHSLVIFYPLLYIGDMALVRHSHFEDNIHGTPLGAFISGTFSVAIFFVLSGFVLSIGFFQTKKTSIVRKLATKRYLRLMLPALGSVLFAWVLIRFKLSDSVGAHAVSQSWALDGVWSFVPHFFDALYEGVVGIFFQGTPARGYYNSVLWTMQYEFFGSFIIFGFIVLFGHASKRWILYATLIGGLYSTWYFGFIVGMLLADMYAHRQDILKKIGQPALYGLLVLGVCLGAFPTASTSHTIYEIIKLPWLDQSQNQIIYTGIGATFVIIAVMNIRMIRKFMASSFMSRLGKYTYSLYLVHQPIIYTLGTGLFMLFIGHMGYNRSVTFAILLTIPVVIIATLLFHKYIETPAMSVASYFEEVFSGKRLFSDDVQNIKARLLLEKKVDMFRKRFSVTGAESEVDRE